MTTTDRMQVVHKISPRSSYPFARSLHPTPMGWPNIHLTAETASITALPTFITDPPLLVTTRWLFVLL